MIFYLFNVDLNDERNSVNSHVNFNDIKNGLSFNTSSEVHQYNQNNLYNKEMRYDNNFLTQFMPGPPFVFGSLMVVCAILVAIFIKEEQAVIDAKRTSIVGERKSNILVSVLVLFYFKYCLLFNKNFLIYRSPAANSMASTLF